MMQTITEWTRRTTSSFGGSRPPAGDTEFPQTVVSEPDKPGDLVYRLKRWPELPTAMRTAEVLRLLSLLSSRPLRRSWILERTRLGEEHLEMLTKRLSAQGALDIFDPALLPTRAFALNARR
ncbi:hypothetical protein [Ramlibacter sp. Leaf400]|uniref:hypothetical protein n=1 Tax=Ramlibacter sp. Leaf400 TaxID=1736365 RepID=UPI0006F8B21A|nr:hypothetical protein [Ramlibacter sp. Leaf400]KQT13683.1 hypothetical protein ASG30_19925 [Ramlibacter sp. Leaf400]